ncbi:hypothetical protein PZN02_005410 [Sinorhizobium garamanticum]|uniref:Uncharacterized protein n=1 Tax=Sinorhizobium garamanticum TaxID=680247 RepID=A0ABY8DGN0_9HYPH|nr:hypothetical protein [Sinorhizobium garamanticum]WEX90061.1 hypothetical protein PZN02_005410 [Sinorhizobium garamanticum]
MTEHIRSADDSSAEVKRFLDRYIARAGLDAPPPEEDPAETIAARLPDPPIRSIDWATIGIRSVIWCTGFKGNFRWVHLNGALDAVGQPVQKDGIGIITASISPALISHRRESRAPYLELRKRQPGSPTTWQKEHTTCLTERTASRRNRRRPVLAKGTRLARWIAALVGTLKGVSATAD